MRTAVTVHLARRRCKSHERPERLIRLVYSWHQRVRGSVTSRQAWRRRQLAPPNAGRHAWRRIAAVRIGQTPFRRLELWAGLNRRTFSMAPREAGSANTGLLTSLFQAGHASAQTRIIGRHCRRPCV